MLSRTLSLATVTLLIAGFLAAPALAQNQNLEAGKSPSQIFAGTCTACHKGPRGLLKTVPPSSLQGYLRQHYTTSPAMASLLAGFLVSNGAADTRHTDQPKSARGEKPETRPGAAPDQVDRFGRRLRTAPPQDAAKLESEPRDASKPPDGSSEPGRQGRNAKRLVRPGEPSASEGETPAQVSRERGSAQQKLSRRGKPNAEESAKSETAKTDHGKEEPAKTESGQEEASKNEAAKAPEKEAAKLEDRKSDGVKSEGVKSEGGPDSGKAEVTKSDTDKSDTDKGASNSGKSESAKIEIPNEGAKPETPALRPDSVSPKSKPAAVATTGTPEPVVTPAAVQPKQPRTESPQAVAASAPPPVAPAGPPAPPISR